jgi:hypothetical protein
MAAATMPRPYPLKLNRPIQTDKPTVTNNSIKGLALRKPKNASIRKLLSRHFGNVIAFHVTKIKTIVAN